MIGYPDCDAYERDTEEEKESLVKVLRRLLAWHGLCVLYPQFGRKEDIL